jgi:COP9 signalosome complex subunit 8
MKAKFLWKRLPTHLKSENSELYRLWQIARCLIQRKYAQAFEIANQYKQSNQNWQNKELTNLFDYLIEKSKERLFLLVNVAYSSISIRELALNLGLSPEETTKIAQNQGWSIDNTNSYLLPKKLGKFFILLKGVKINFLK